MTQPEVLPDKSSLPEINSAELKDLYRRMLLIRRVEELAAKAYTQRKILGFCHLYIGQESVAVGAAASTKDDYWMAAYREHGQAMAKGMSARKMMAELFGRATGSSGGQGGSMHLFDKESKFMGGYGIVGGHVPLATGVAWAAKQRKEGKVCVCFFGDGAANQGAFFEALCLAQLFKHRRSIIYTPEDHALVQERCACGPEVSERTASGAVDLCRVVDVQDNHYLERSRRQPLQ